MDIGKIVQSETLFRLDLKDPVTDAPLGIVFMIRSASSDAVKKVDRKHLDEITERQQRGKMVKGEMRLQHELERSAAYIASWDWGEHDINGEKPILTQKNAVAVLESVGWIYAQVKEAAETLANFSGTAQAS